MTNMLDASCKTNARHNSTDQQRQQQQVMLQNDSYVPTYSYPTNPYHMYGYGYHQPTTKNLNNTQQQNPNSASPNNNNGNDQKQYGEYDNGRDVEEALKAVRQQIKQTEAALQDTRQEQQKLNRTSFPPPIHLPASNKNYNYHDDIQQKLGMMYEYDATRQAWNTYHQSSSLLMGDNNTMPLLLPKRIRKPAAAAASKPINQVGENINSKKTE